jgi:hypothetical protein
VTTGRTRRPRTLTASLASIVLATEFLVVVLAALVVFGLRALPAPLALGGGGALLLVIAVAAATARSRIGIVLGWLVQVVLVAAVVIQPAVGVVGVVFAALWVYCMIVGGRIDRRAASQSERTGA